MAASEISDFTAECPHCHTTVIPRDDGQCPACLRNVNELTGTDANVTSLTISEGQTLPLICFRCGRAAQSTRRAAAKRKNPYVRSNSVTTAMALLGLPFILLFLFFRKLIGVPTRDYLQIQLPICRECALRESGGTLKPIHIDFDNYEMTFLVHKDFRTAVTASGN